MANTALITNAANANKQAQILQVLALKVYNDAVKLLGNIATAQTSITASSGLYQTPDMQNIAETCTALTTQLQYIDNSILALQQSANIVS